MEKTFIDQKQIAANKRALRHLAIKATDLIPFWEKLNPETKLTTDHLRNWIGDADYIYQVFRQNQLDAGMTAVVFDSLPEASRRPPLDEPRQIPNPLAVTRHGPGVTSHTVSGPPKPGRTYAIVHQVCRIPEYMKVEAGVKVFVDKTWLEVHRGEVRAVKDADKRIEKACTIEYTPQQIALAESLGGMLEAFKNIHDACGGKLPIAVDPQGKVEGIDWKKLTQI